VRTFTEVMSVAPAGGATPLAQSWRDFVYAEVWTRPGLDRRARRWISLTCLGYNATPAVIEANVRAALESGDINLTEMREFVLHFAVYCGWSKATVLDDVVSTVAGKLNLTSDTPPIQSEPWNPQKRLDVGAAGFESVMTMPGPKPDSPYYEGGIMNFVFGEMWDRPGLDRKSRRWITLASVALCDTIIPITSHIYAAMNSGQCSREEMLEFVLQFAVYAGWPKASFLQSAVTEQWAKVEKGLPFF
jgi:4-carboxymuconolactone decarboxylase